MKRIWMILPFVLAVLNACDSLDRVGDGIVDNYETTRERVHDWTYGENHEYYGAQPAPVRLAEPRYCYKVMADIICYARPQPKLADNLVGSQ